MKRKHRTKRTGFTLIEIIAVLVILGILAAVAVPKYLTVQQEAAKKAAEGALAAALSACSMKYAESVLKGETFTCPTGSDVSTSGDELEITITQVANSNPVQCAINVNYTKGNLNGAASGSWTAPITDSITKQKLVQTGIDGLMGLFDVWKLMITKG